jgi:phage baseplate assembly protein V
MSARTAGVEGLSAPDMERRIANTVRFGSVMEVDHDKRRMRVKSGDIETNWIPWPAGRAAAGKRRWDAPEVGEQGVLLCAGGDMRQAVFVPGVYQDSYDSPSSDPNKDHTTYGDGTVIEYDRGSHTMLVDLTGGVSITADRAHIELKIGSTTLTLTGSQTTLVTPFLHVQSPESTFTGHVTIQGGLNVSGGGGVGSGASAVFVGHIEQVGNYTQTGNFTQTGNSENTGTLKNNGKNVGSGHTHSGVQTGNDTTGAVS